MTLYKTVLHNIVSRVPHKNCSQFINHRIKMKFCANLSFMFTEKPFIERYSLAKNAGFKTVESGFPFGYSLDQVLKAKTEADIDQLLINIYTGDTSKGELGIACQPGKENEFKEHLSKTIDYAKSLKCKLLHIMAGNLNEESTDVHWTTYESNLMYSAESLAKEGIVGLIEPINRHTVPKYFMSSYEKAIDIIKRINSPNLRLMLDVFHLQQIKGDISHSIADLLPYVGHVQIAQVPNRHEPDTPGELDYRYILNLLENKGYNGYVGLEYTPLNGTEKGLEWIENFGYTLN